MSEPQTDPQQFPFPYGQLRRRPDAEAPNLFAADATDRLLVDTAARAVREAQPGSVVVVGDRYGALTLACSALGATGIRVHQDSYTARLALEANRENLHPAPAGAPQFRSMPLGAELFEDASVVLLQLPKQLDQLDRWAARIAAYAQPEVTVFAGGRVKHMTPAMTRMLERHFQVVTATRARQKSRLLIATKPVVRPAAAGRELTETFDADTGLWVSSSPGVFSAGKVDIGTRFLLPFIEDLPAHQVVETERPVAVDLGCGTGILAAKLLASRPEYHVIATDRSEVAARSAEATLLRNFPDVQLDRVPAQWGLSAEVRHDHGLLTQADSSVDLLLCNPPFHTETDVSALQATLLFEEAARVLKPGGVMLTVFNSHLPHRRVLERVVGVTEQLGRGPKFTVTRSVKPG